MLTAEENSMLCRVGPGTQMGAMMRRYWLPVLLSSDLEPNGDPKRVRLLGEDLVAFRDSEGRVGLLDELCPHRRASLALGRNENGYIECLYHGWRIDCGGRIIDTPVEPEGSTFKNRVRATAYQTCEAGGVIWAYLGPPERTPSAPAFHFTQVAPERVLILRSLSSANWAQGVEGVIDSSHSNFLHKNGIRPSKDVVTTIRSGEGFARRPSDDSRPRMEVEDMPYGFRYAAIRKPIVDAEMKAYIRISHFIAPVFVLFPPPRGWVWMQAFTPVDDEHTIFWNFQVHDRAIDAEERAILLERALMRPAVDLDEQMRPAGNRDNRWLQDRAAMRRGESHTGLAGVGREDFAVQESMGPILDRSKEHLGVSDTAVIRFRRLMLDAVRRVDASEPLPALAEPLDLGYLRAEEEMLPIDADWHAIGKRASMSV